MSELKALLTKYNASIGAEVDDEFIKIVITSNNETTCLESWGERITIESSDL